MNIVLDTCTYYWLVDDQTQLSATALSAIGNANNSLHLSAITVTEIHRLVRKAKISIHAPNGLEYWFQQGLAHHGVTCEPITLAIAHAAEMLPAIHQDPADRFILATAQLLGGGGFSRPIPSCRSTSASSPSGDAGRTRCSNLPACSPG